MNKVYVCVCIWKNNNKKETARDLVLRKDYNIQHGRSYEHVICSLIRERIVF